MLGRAGYHGVLIDIHKSYPPAFRCEKLDDVQVSLLQQTGLAAEVLPATTFSRDLWRVTLGGSKSGAEAHTVFSTMIS